MLHLCVSCLCLLINLTLVLLRYFMAEITLYCGSRISPNLKSVVYCNAIREGGVDEWNFAWSMYENATIASEAEKLMHALTCTTESWLLSR